MKYKFDNSLDEKGKPIHLHTLDDKPLTGTTSIIDVLAKPLTWWASGLACEKFGWVNSKKKIDGKYQVIHTEEERLDIASKRFEEIKSLDNKSFLSLLDEAYKAHSVRLDDTAKKGTDLHAELEKFVKSRMGKNKETEFDEKIKPFIEWTDKNVKEFLASEAHCYSERLWVGGGMDAVAELNDGTIAVIDFKSAKEAYMSHFIQCGGYAIQIEENGLFDETGEHNKKVGSIDKLIVVAFGSEKVLPEIRCNVSDFKNGFESAVVLYRLMGLEKQQ